ncbi:NAD(P)H-dependent oxidoreductase [Xanthobacter versatilis]|uniref:NAD(P)H-dependent oxidoreductase n=1 Tax=Xanthobacter autotrophicus (strain ATCC BAA-1158 / Py2) TaxID=78245 RepID=UPI00372CC3C3
MPNDLAGWKSAADARRRGDRPDRLNHRQLRRSRPGQRQESDPDCGFWRVTDGPWRPWDYVEPYLRQILGFIGITDVRTIRVEGMNIPGRAAGAVPRGTEAVGELAL